MPPNDQVKYRVNQGLFALEPSSEGYSNEACKNRSPKSLAPRQTSDKNFANDLSLIAQNESTYLEYLDSELLPAGWPKLNAGVLRSGDWVSNMMQRDCPL